MYAGFVTHKHTIKRLGVHQRLDAAAYRMTSGYFGYGRFPLIKQIWHFEGKNGPDDLKFKLPYHDGPSHFYDPNDGGGDLPESIQHHYKGLVRALRQEDQIKAAFEASWLAHYIVDGLTPAHHELPEKELEEICGGQVPISGRVKGVATGPGSLKTNWRIWVEKRVIPAHHNFEVGIAWAMMGRPIRVKLDPVKLARAKQIGYLDFFREEAKTVAQIDLYSEFRRKGWTPSIAASVRTQIVPVAVQAVGITWLLAYLEADMAAVKEVALAAAA